MTVSEKKKLADLVIKRIQMVYTNSQVLAKMFKSDSVAVKGFESMVSELRVQENNTEILKALNKVFDAITHACYKFAGDNETSRIPLEYIKIVVDKAVKDTKAALV